MRVQLIAYTPNPDEVVATAARQCYSGAGLDALREKVSAAAQEIYLQKLTDSGHLSPLEHVSFTFGVEGVSRALLAQLTRHRIASFSVRSQRYVSGYKRPFGYVIPPAVLKLGNDATNRYLGQMRQLQDWYDDWIDAGLEPEDARYVLPNACHTQLLVTMNARELLHFFSLRCCNRAQWEIRHLAWEMLHQCKEVAPALFKDAGPGCARGECPEGEASCKNREE